MEYRLLIHSAKQLVQVVANGENLVCGPAMAKLAILDEEDGQGISIVVDKNGFIAAIEKDDKLNSVLPNAKYEVTIDAKGKCVLPGFVDGHTHPVWAGDRVHEFAMKLAGATYLEVYKAGGGIQFTVDHTHKATSDELYKLLLSRLSAMLECGTTLAECKTGYGLTHKTELAQLELLNRARREHPIDVSVTFCGAHAVPKGLTADQATEVIIRDMLPEIVKRKGPDFVVDNFDVFCEKGFYDLEQTRRLLEAAKKSNLKLNFHGDELSPMKSAELGAELGATGISHLEEISDDGVAAMSRSKSVAVLLPTTAFVQRLKAPPARKMIETGVPVALGSDFNPNAFCYSMPLVMNLACVLFHLSPAEALVAATINAAASLGQSEKFGSLEVGKRGDIIVLNSPRWEHVIYQMDCHNRLIDQVIKGGKVVHSNAKHSPLI